MNIKVGRIDRVLERLTENFFEALGFKHYQGSPHVDDKKLRECYIDRIYDVYIDEEELQHQDRCRNDGPFHDRRRRSKKLCPRHRHLRGNAGP
ncbi:MAG: deoxyhypusine synthase family protein [Proteobacteria bacterium]|nr:deoxyhypusine synthase family protein [Pseudomonadota bacterium]